jgi:prepilin peptidase CpaA
MKETMLQAAVLVLFPALMIFAAVSDLFTMTISNRVSIALVLIFIPLAYFSGMAPADIAVHLAIGFAILVVTFGMFAFGWIGGGDAKLAAATAIWVGWDRLADYGLDAALTGGLLTLCILQLRRWPLPAWAHAVQWLPRLHDRNAGVPYGIALAAAGLFVYPETHLWTAALAG